MVHSVIVQQAYTTIVNHFIRIGRAPHYTELASLMGVTPDEARDLQQAAAISAMGCWLTPDTDYIGSWAPFSNVPTQYRVSVAGESKWYGQWGLESLAVRWLFPGQEVTIESHCLDCGEPFQIRMRDDAILEVNPSTIVGHVNIAFLRRGEFTDAYR